MRAYYYKGYRLKSTTHLFTSLSQFNSDELKVELNDKEIKNLRWRRFELLPPILLLLVRCKQFQQQAE